jgi:hypothetical protein
MKNLIKTIVPVLAVVASGCVWKFWETLLLSLISWDLFVEADKLYRDKEKDDNPFYTSLKPWNRTALDMWDFSRFLEFWGWKL